MGTRAKPTTTEAIIEHLKPLVTGLLECPICGHRDWQVNEPVASMLWKRLPDGRVDLTSESFPVVPLICNQCFHVLTFAWLPIEKKMAGR